MFWVGHISRSKDCVEVTVRLVVTSSRLVRVRARSISCSHTPCVELEEGREPTLLIPDAQVLGCVELLDGRGLRWTFITGRSPWLAEAPSDQERESSNDENEICHSDSWTLLFSTKKNFFCFSSL